MKMSHLYFDKYCTRTVQTEKSTGLFIFDGEAVPREYMEDPQKHESLKQTLLRNQTMSSNFHQSSPTYTIKSPIVSSQNHSHTQHILQKAKIKQPHPEEVDEMRAKEVALLKHIYHDNNFVRIQSEKRPVVTVGNRTWLPAEKLLRFTEASHSCVVSTPAPLNRSLGLTPLRMHGSGGQDKPHHIPVSHSVTRLKITYG